MARAEKNKVKSVTKIFKILEEMARYDQGIKLTELARNSGFPASTTHRFILSLREEGYVQQDPETGTYSLGVKFLSLASSVLNDLDLREIARSFLKKLRDKTGETANLAILEDGEALYIEKCESRASVRVFSLIGRRAPLHATGVGKILLSDWDKSDLTSFFEKREMEQLTSQTITDLNLFIKELDQVRKQGFAFDREECEMGAMCIAAPVRNHMGKIIASISVSAPTTRFSDKISRDWIKILKVIAGEVSSTLGYVER
ncbi:MAG: IclR family transcriptional regulator [bacterium]